MRKELERFENRRRFYRTVRSTVSVLIVVAAIAVLAASFLFPVLRIYGTSMAPTLSEGDLILCVRTERAEPGDLIAFYYGNKVLVKRCIAIATTWRTSAQSIAFNEVGRRAIITDR